MRSLSRGRTGCLRGGRYSFGELTIGRRGITLTSYPGRRATLQGRLRVTAPRVTVSHLRLDGRNAGGLPSPTVNADGVRFRHDNVSNKGTSSCFILGSRGEVHRVVIARNRIHDCGRASLPFDHGIYMQNVDDALITSNAIYDNASRGIKVGPDSQRALIRANVIDGNAIGLSFSGNDSRASSDNVVEHNVVSNSRRAWNVQTFWVGSNFGRGNILRRNCLFATNRNTSYNKRGGAESAPGFRSRRNIRANPHFVNRRAKDFRLRRGSRCLSVYPR